LGDISVDDTTDSSMESRPPKKVKIKATTTAITPHVKKAFAEQKTSHPEWLTFGLDYIKGRLRAKCFKHDTVKVLAEVDVTHGASHEARASGTQVEGFLSCGCRIEGLILDHLAFKVKVIGHGMK